MTTFDQFFPAPKTLSMVTVDYLNFLAEARGRQGSFTNQSPQLLTSLRRHAVIESAISSNRIEGVEVELARAEQVVFGKSALHDRPEEEVRGYREALDLIHAKEAQLPVNEKTILKLHKLVRGEIADAGKYKERADPIIERYPDGRQRVRFMPVESGRVRPALHGLLDQWKDSVKTPAVPGAVALGAFNLDFLCIHPFRDGNGRVSRLLLLLQTYHLGFEVGRYISLERIIEENKDRYYETLEIGSGGWHENRQDAWPFINFVLYILKSAYKEFEERLAGAKVPRGAKSEQIHAAISRLPDEFTVKDVERAAPGVSREMIRHVLRELKREGEITCDGRGPGAPWRKKVIASKRGKK